MGQFWDGKFKFGTQRFRSPICQRFAFLSSPWYTASKNIIKKKVNKSNTSCWAVLTSKYKPTYILFFSRITKLLVLHYYQINNSLIFFLLTQGIRSCKKWINIAILYIALNVRDGHHFKNGLLLLDCLAPKNYWVKIWICVIMHVTSIICKDDRPAMWKSTKWMELMYNTPTITFFQTFPEFSSKYKF